MSDELLTSDIAFDRHHRGHDLYVTDATYAAWPVCPRVLLRCCRCGRLAVGLIETEEDRAYAATKDREFDTGEWWWFDRLRLIGLEDTPCRAWHGTARQRTNLTTLQEKILVATDRAADKIQAVADE